jgi:GDP-4-dehydro-6-deoxy-D-mannose reductase
MILASTAEIYGRAFASGAPLPESSAVAPTNAYARSKLAAEIALSETIADVCPVIALRLCNHTGPGQDERFVVPTFAAQIARIEAGVLPPVLKVGNLTAERDFMGVADVIEAYIAALRYADEAQGFRIYNVGSGTTRTIGSILEGLSALSSARFEVVQDPARMRPSDIPRAVCDVAAFSAATGWSAKSPWSATLAAVLNYWRDACATSG